MGHCSSLQVFFNGVSLLTLVVDAHMRTSAIRLYLISLVLSGMSEYVQWWRKYCISVLG